VCRLPLSRSALPLFQLVYKALWLGTQVLPTYLKTGSVDVPISLALIFAGYVAVLPFVVPWRHLFGGKAAMSGAKLD
jgi:hypothetical protein